MPNAPHTLNTLDRFIGDRLPAWLSRATPEQIAHLRVLYSQHRQAEERATRVLNSLHTPTAFAKKELEAVIFAQTGSHVDLSRALWRERRQNFSLMGGDDLLVCTHYEPALAHLMQNFPAGAQFAERDGLVVPRAGLDLYNAALLMPSEQLARLCHSADLGQRYQAHLNGIVTDAVVRDWAQEHRARLTLAVGVAELQGHLGAADLDVLQVVLGQPSRGTQVEPASVRCRQLSILGCRVTGALVIEARSRQSNGVLADHLLLYFTHGALMPFADWTALSNSLCTRLRDPSSLAWMSNALPMGDRPAFLVTLRKRLADPVPDLEVAGLKLTGDPFDALARLHSEYLRANAAYVLVTSAQADARQRRERLDTWEEVGSSLLQVAAFFVPGLNELLLTKLVIEVLQETFEGIRDWQRGHQHEAVEHLLGVAETVAVNAVAAAGGKSLAQWYRRSPQVESMMPVSTPHGDRLWLQDLGPYRTPKPPASARLTADGLYHDGNRRWWRHDQAYHEVRAEQGQWQLMRHDGATRFGPRLQTNGDGGWWLTWQRPQAWQESRTLLAYLWPASGDLSTACLDHAMSIAQVGLRDLQRLVTYQQALPVALRDSLERAALSARIDAFFAKVDAGALPQDTVLMATCLKQLDIAHRPANERRAALQLHQMRLRTALMDTHSADHMTRDPLATIVLTAFPGLPDVYAHAIVRNATAAQRQYLSAKLSVPLALAEQARAALLEARITRALQALYWRNCYADRLPELVFALLRRQGGWPVSANVELRGETTLSPVLAQLFEAQPAVHTLVHRDGELHLYRADRRILLQPGDAIDLFGVLLQCLSPQARAELGWDRSDAARAMRIALQQQLPGDRAALLKLLGWHRDVRRVRAPQRLPDRRFGYLLSGRGQAGNLVERTLQDRARSLYPGFTAEQLQTYLHVLHDQPGSAFDALLEDERNYQELDRSLHRWSMEAGTEHLRLARGQMADVLRRCWRMQGPEGRRQADGLPGRALSLAGLNSTQLPALPQQTAFSHVTELSLQGLQLQDIPADFLRPFTGLRVLNLDDNRLTRLPAALSKLEHLEELTLAGNQLRLDNRDYANMARLSALRTLVLNRNPLGDFSLALQRFPRLRQLGLRETGLTRVPVDLRFGLSLDTVDLRDNLIEQLPSPLDESRASLRSGIVLQGNPVAADVVRRWQGLETPSASESEPSADIEPSNVDSWLSGFTAAERIGRAARWARLMDEPMSEDLFALLHELTGTSDYRLVREDLQARVWSVLEAIENDTAMRETLFALAQAPRSCVDGAISTFSALEVRTLSAAALRDEGKDAQASLLKLARGLFRLDQVERLANQDMERRRLQHRDVDEVEVSLAYRVGLATSLDLPGQPRSLQFARVAGITTDDLEAASSAVLAAETTDALVLYIAQRDFWMRHLRQLHAPEFDAVEAPFWDRMDALDETRETLDDRRYLDAVSHLAGEREAAVATLVSRLTREALGEVST